MTVTGFVLVDRRTGEVRGGLSSFACLYSREAAERTLKEFTSEKNREHWVIRKATLEVEETS
jgi:hypothetical protein